MSEQIAKLEANLGYRDEQIVKLIRDYSQQIAEIVKNYEAKLERKDEQIAKLLTLI